MNLKKLAWATLILVGLAALGLLASRWWEGRASGAKVGSHVLDAVLMKQARQVVVSHDKDQTTLRSSPQGWRVAEQHDFPADQGQLGRLLLQLSEEKINRQVSDKLETAAELRVLVPQELSADMSAEDLGTSILLKDAQGQVLFQLVLGEQRGSHERGGQGMPNMGGGTFVRFPPDKRTFLVFSNLSANSKPADWLEHQLFDFDAAKQAARVSLQRAGAGSMQVTRAKADAAWAVPGAAAPNAQSPNAQSMVSLLNTLADLGPKTVLGKGAPTGKLAHLELALLDGRVYKLDVAEAADKEGTHDFSVSAVMAPGVTDGKLAEAVSRFNARYEGYLMTLENWRAERLLNARKDVFPSASAAGTKASGKAQATPKTQTAPQPAKPISPKAKP